MCALLVSTLAGGLRAGAQTPADPAAAHQHQADPQAEHDAGRGHYGAYPMSRDASGTAWQPDSSPMPGIHAIWRGWSLMAHGVFNAAYVDESGPRGDSSGFGAAMGMVAGRRARGRDMFGFRLMATTEPAIGARGYPLLLQTGETSDGVTPLVDRQHPHDFVMELAGTWSRTVGESDSVFVYVAAVGAPPIGPAPFMHRASGEDIPHAPIGHHFLDSTHITYGVVTVGFTTGRLKFEGGAFNGREPDERRWGVERPRLDSFAGRMTVNPHRDWSLQWSAAHVNSPEQLHAGIDVTALTASATYNRQLAGGNWQTTLAWGRSRRRPPSQIDDDFFDRLFESGGHLHFAVVQTVAPRPPLLMAALLESAATVGRHTVSARFETTEKDELFPTDDPRHATRFAVGRTTVGYIVDVQSAPPYRLGVGVTAAALLLPAELRSDYGSTPRGLSVFTRLRF